MGIAIPIGTSMRMVCITPGVTSTLTQTIMRSPAVSVRHISVQPMRRRKAALAATRAPRALTTSRRRARHPSRERRQSARGACRQLRPDANQALDRTRHGLYRLGGGIARSADQHDLRAALFRRRLACRRRQREPRHRALFARLLQPGQSAGLLALRVKCAIDHAIGLRQLRPRIPSFIPSFIPNVVPTGIADECLAGRTIWPQASPALPRVIGAARMGRYSAHSRASGGPGNIFRTNSAGSQFRGDERPK
jgi:hypothetical protein